MRFGFAYPLLKGKRLPFPDTLEDLVLASEDLVLASEVLFVNYATPAGFPIQRDSLVFLV